MDTPLSPEILNLIDRLFVYSEKHEAIIDHLIAIGREAVPFLLAAFRDKEFVTNQGAVHEGRYPLRRISTALSGIVDKAADPAAKDEISLPIVNDMAAQVTWEPPPSSSLAEQYNFNKYPANECLFYRANEAAVLLGLVKDSRALPALIEVTKSKDSHPTIRENAIIALGRIGDERAIPHLIELVDTHNYCLHFAINSLADMGNKAAVSPLLNTLEYWNGMDADDIRANLIWALGQLHDSRAVPKLIEWVKANEKDMKAVAVQALGNIGHPDAIPVLEACLNDATVLHRQDFGGTFWLFRRFRENKICDTAAEALRQIGTPEALGIVERWQGK